MPRSDHWQFVDFQADAVAYERGERPLRTRTWQQEAQGWTLARDEVSAPPARLASFSPPPQYDGARIRAIRTKLRMSQRLFASALNVSNRTVQAWERDARRPVFSLTNQNLVLRWSH